VPSLDRAGTRVHYQATRPPGGADAPAVVFLHNIFCDGRVFSHATAALGARYRTIAIDFRGHGGSEVPRRPYSIQDLAEDTLAVLDQEGVARAAVVGLSVGATVAVELALRHPERVDRLVLMGADVEADPFLATLRNSVLSRLVRLIGLRRFLVAAAVKNLFGASFRAETGPGLAGWFERISALGGRAAAFALRCWASRPIRLGALPALRAPVLVVVGDEDVSCPPACGEKIQRAVAGARLVRIPRAGHTMPAERPEPTTAAIAGFLG
jgi:pimeloyl-ACP methyl ester carboxylesterase